MFIFVRHVISAMVLLDLLALSSLGQGVSFGSPIITNLVGAGALAVGDFNGDKQLDLAVGGTALYILLGKGDGTFQTGQTFDVAGAPAVADLNGDGKPDVILMTATEALILPGNGDGTFKPPVHLDTATTNTAIAIADFNRDGKLDLAVSNCDGNVLILFGDGLGGIQFVSAIPVNSDCSTSPVNIVSADFNGDDAIDLAILHAGGSDLLLLLNNGGGSFRLGSTIQVQLVNLLALVAADFNGDHKADLATTDYIDALFVLLGNGDGSFQPPTRLLSGGFPLSIAAADFNGDGNVDLAISNFRGGSGITVVLGNGDGTFQPESSFSVGGFPSSVSVGDFNGDGKTDLVTTGVTENGTSAITVLLNNSDDFLFSVSPANRSLVAGQTATFTLTASPTAGFDKTVSFACGDLPPAATCMFQPASLSGGGSSTLSVITSGNTAVLRHPVRTGQWMTAFALFAFGFPLLVLPVRQRFLHANVRLRPASKLGVFLLLFLSACGGNGNGGHPPTTPPGNYTISVTASAGSLHHSANVVLAVQ